MTGHTPDMDTTRTRECRDHCQNTTLVDEGATWSVWQCRTCDRRRTHREELSLFGRRELEIPLQPDGEGET